MFGTVGRDCPAPPRGAPRPGMPEGGVCIPVPGGILGVGVGSAPMIGMFASFWFWPGGSAERTSASTCRSVSWTP